MKTKSSKQYVVGSMGLFLTLLILTACYLLPTTLHGQEEGRGQYNLIVCDGPDCDFGDLVRLVQNLINFMIILSTFFATAAFAYAGTTLLTSGGNESAKTKAKDIFKKVMFGYLWILGAWLVVYTITSVLGGSNFSTVLGQ
jgi:hypothetical protein